MGLLILKTLRKRRMLHVVLPLFIVSIIAFLDRVNIALCRLDYEGEFTVVDARSIWYGAGIISLLVMFCLKCLHPLIAARCNAMHWVARIMFSWGLVCILMTTMTTELEFYVYRFFLVYVRLLYIL